MAKNKKQNDLELEDETTGDAAAKVETVQVHRGNHFANVSKDHPEAKRHLAKLAADKKKKADDDTD